MTCQSHRMNPTHIFANIIQLMFLRILEIISMGVANSVPQLLIRLIMIIIRSPDGYSPLNLCRIFLLSACIHVNGDQWDALVVDNCNS